MRFFLKKITSHAYLSLFERIKIDRQPPRHYEIPVSYHDLATELLGRSSTLLPQ